MLDIATASADEILADQVASLAVRRLCEHRDVLVAKLAEAMGMATRNRTSLTQLEKDARRCRMLHYGHSVPGTTCPNCGTSL